MKKKIIIFVIIMMAILVIACLKNPVQAAISANFATKRTVAGIYDAMNTKGTAWVTVTPPNSNELTDWDNEAGAITDKAAGVIHSRGGACFGHATSGSSVKKNVSVVTVDGAKTYGITPYRTVNKDASYGDLILAYNIYKSANDVKEEDNDSTYKNKIKYWCHTNSSSYDVTIQTDDVYDTNYDSDANAKQYASNIQNRYNNFKTDDTKSKPTIHYDGVNTYIGPYNLHNANTSVFQSGLTHLKNAVIETKTGKTITTDKYSTSANGTIQTLSSMPNYSGDSFYIVVEGKVDSIEKITLNKDLEKLVSRIVLTQPKASGGQNVAIFYGYYTTETITIDLPGVPYTDLTITKIDTVTGDKMANVGFMVYCEGKGFVQEGLPANYVADKSDATVFKTDNKGEIIVKNLSEEGNYIVYEVVNPYYGYEHVSVENPLEIKKFDISTLGEPISLEIPNTKIYIKLSGYVWLDKIDIGKTSKRDDLFNDSDYSSDDKLFNGITVRLKDRTTGETVMTTTTSELGRYTESPNNGNGEYLFEDVLIEKLKDYYIEFEYDGLTYTNVLPHTEVSNGSKAAETAEGKGSRSEFNEGFNSVEGTGRETGITRDSNGNEIHQLSYSIDDTGHVATLNSDSDYETNDLYVKQNNVGQYTITANTDITGYSINDRFVYEEEEIKYINLGLYEREQPDIAIVKDLQNVRLTINGYEHTYTYAQRFVNAGEYGDGFNVGVKFGSKYGSMSYTRAIYKADYEYINEKDKDKELKVYVTYQLTMRNQSSNLTAQINSLLDYYDNKYQIVNIGNSLDEKGNVVGDIAHTETAYNNDYTKTVITNPMRIEAQKEETIYVQFALNREAVINILNDKENLDNVVEINSYSIYDGDKIYAGIDTDSNPGNCVPGDTTTYEDDTDASPALKLEVADSREIAGKVFLDSTSGELKTGEIRQGSGIYEEGETGIEGVDITLTENTGSGKVYTAKTDGNGDFLITDYIPGDYTLTYTWGDETYTVQDYKGTVYHTGRDQNDKNWYKQDVSTRYTDAIDNYGTDQEAPKGSRKQIDSEIGTVNTANITRTKMDSTTPTMGIGVEYETTYTASMGDKYTYRIENVDFGIVERAKQVLDVSKKVTGIKITLANGQTIVDGKIVDGKLEGDAIKDLIYQGPSNGDNGLVWAQIDNELIQGATVQIEYTVSVANKSEVDYDSENYYKYGIKEGNIIQMKPEGVYDYLDSEMVLDGTKDNGNWEIISSSDYNTTYTSPTMIESYFSDGKTTETREDGTEVTIYRWEASENTYQNLFTEWATEVTEHRTVRDAKLNNKTILHNANLEKELQPGESNTVNLYTSKVLSNADEIDLNNDAETTEIRRVQQTGRIPDVKTSHTYGQGETVTVTPPTGESQNYVIPIVIGITAFIILGAGVVIIKKKVIE